MFGTNVYRGVKITSLKEAHLQHLAELANNPSISTNLMDRFPHPYLLKDAYEFWELVKKEEPQITFAIEYHKAFCGIISITPQKDIYRLNAELGYWIGEPFWGQGITTAAIKKVSKYGFSTLGLNRIYARVFDFNQASMKALEKNDFKKEAILEKAAIKNEQLLDIHLYGKSVQ